MHTQGTMPHTLRTLVCTHTAWLVRCCNVMLTCGRPCKISSVHGPYYGMSVCTLHAGGRRTSGLRI